MSAISTASINPAFRVRSAPSSEPPARLERHLRVVPDPPAQLSIEDFDVPRFTQAVHRDVDALFAAQRTRERHLPAIDEFARRYFLSAAEVLTGHRSVDQLAPNTSLAVQTWMRGLVPHHPTDGRRGPAPRVLAVHVFRIKDAVIEASAVLARGPYVKAMTARFIGLDRRWQCIHLGIV